jgi:cyclopropane fatty-acyl-phospholipid synthase-like methyltransferase
MTTASGGETVPVAYSAASERNKGPILKVLVDALRDCREVLEIGSGTGQHAVHFARSLPYLQWQPTELAGNIPDLMERIAREGTPNLRTPIALDVRQHPWPIVPADGVFTANTFHIMDWESVRHFFKGIGTLLKASGVLCVYGPFRYAGRFTTESNAAFDLDLRARDPASGIRDFEAVNELAEQQGLTLLADHAMPANNQTLVWKRVEGKASRPGA